MQYAARVAATLPEGDDVIIGGSSFGSMLAVEVARVRRPRALVVVGGAVNERGVPLLLRIGAAVAARLPVATFALLHWTGALAAPFFGARTREQRALFVEMLRACPRDYIAWCISAIASWRAAPLAGVADVVVVHGRADLVLPARLVKSEGARIVDGAGHLLTWTHADDVNAIIRELLAR